MTPLALVVDNPAVASVTEQALSWPDRARAIVVQNADTYVAAAETLKGIKALRAEVDAAFDPIVKSAFQAHKTAVEQKRKAETPLTEAETIIKRALAVYNDEQERLRRAEQRRLEEEARKAEEARVLELAASMEAEGQQYGDDAMVAEAHAIIERPIVAPPVAPAVKPVPQVAGISHRVTYSAEVVNLLALVQHVAKHPNLLALLKADTTALNGQARSLKEALDLPGVRVIKTSGLAAGR